MKEIKSKNNSKIKSNNKKKKFSINFIHLLAVLFIGMFIGQIINSEIHDNSGHENENYNEMDDMMHMNDSSHSHGTYDATNYDRQLALRIEVYEDPKSGHNLKLFVENLVFDPVDVGQFHLDNYGHAHLYINGKKITRLYGVWHHIPDLKKGENEIRVTLNANDHKEYQINGETIEDTVIVMVE